MKKLISIMIIMTFFLTGCAPTQQGIELDVSNYLYKVSKEGKETYLLATSQAGKEQIYALDHKTEKALNASKILALEYSYFVNPFDEFGKYTTQNSLTELGMHDQGMKLLDNYPDLSELNIPAYNALALYTTVRLYVPTLFDASSNYSSDAFLYNLVSQKEFTFEEIVGIENEYALYPKVSTSCANYVMNMLNDKDTFVKVQKAIYQAYLDNNNDKLEQLFSYDLSTMEAEEAAFYNGYSGYKQNIMKTKIEEYTNNNSKAFVGLNVGYVYGNNGLLVQLRDDGYKVEKMY